MTIHIKTVRTGLANMKQADMRRLLRDALVSLGEYWHARMLPKRFTTSGQNIYHLEARTQSYVRSIIKKFPAWRPLVRRGSLALATQTRYSVKASTVNGGERVTVRMQRAHPTQLYVSDEITMITKDEMAELLKYYKENIIKLMLENNNKKVTA